MRTRTIRGAGAAVLTLGLVTTALTPAQAAPAPTPGASTGTSSRTLESLRANAAHAFTGSASRSSLAATASGLIQTSSVCPAGELPKTLSHEGFETGLPYPDFNDGFTIATGAGAPDGTHWVNSAIPATVDPAAPPVLHLVDSSYAPVPQTGKVFLSFSYRGVFAAGTTAALVNADWWEPAPSSQWSTVTLDITSEATSAGDGTVDVMFGHEEDPTIAGTFDVDNVTMYTCAIPNSGVRGDWTGQGTVDLIGTHSDGSLWVYEGKGNGAVGSGVKVGSGWSTFTWQGSPGDVNGDRRTDMLARRSDGTLWLYAGKGNGTFAPRLSVGTGWNSMTSIATPGDVNLDGRPDLIARRADGTLHLYSILSNGRPQYLRQIGSGWNGMTSILGMGDLNGDKRGDVVAIHRDGTMFSYLSSGTGLTSARRIGPGWNGMTWLTSPGDMNKNGRGDLIARHTSGSLWFYAGRSGGGVISGRQVGSGWNGMARIL